MSSNIEIEAPLSQQIKSVVVFKNSAEVTRVFDVDVKAGQNNVVIKSLPSSLDSESIRVQGLGEAVLLDVIYSPPPARTRGSIFSGGNANPTEETETLRNLESAKALLTGQRRILDHEADALVNYAKSIRAENIPVDKFSYFLDTFKKLGKTNLEGVAAVDSELKKVEREIRKERESPRTEDEQSFKREAKVTVVIQSETNRKVELSITYVVPNASWTPLYNVVAKTNGNGQIAPTVSLHCRASITQSTGEDWKNVALTLSTASPSSFSDYIPKVMPLKIKPQALGFAAYAPAMANSAFAKPSTAIFGQSQPAAQPPAYSTSPLFAQKAATPSTGSNVFGQGGFGAFGARPQLLAQTQQPSFGSAAPAAGTPSSSNSFGSYNGLLAQMQAQHAQQAQQAQQAQTQAQGQTQAQVQAAADGNPSDAIRSSAFGSLPASLDIPRFSQPQPQPQPSDASEFEIVTASSDEGTETQETAAAERPIDQAVASASDSGVTATFQIEGKSTIPSDNSTHKVSISVSELQAVLEWVTAPRYKAAVYLQAQIKNSTAYSLLPGSATILLDGSYLSKTAIGRIAPKDTFTCSFGQDPNVRISYDQSSKKTTTNAHTFALQTETVVHTNTITVHNGRKNLIHRLLIRDSIPVSEDARMKVILVKPKDLATTKSGDSIKVEEGVIAKWSAKETNGMGGEAQGKMEWLCADIAPGATKNLSLVWEVSSPVGVKWTTV